jgi:hypothetical protein
MATAKGFTFEEHQGKVAPLPVEKEKMVEVKKKPGC